MRFLLGLIATVALASSFAVADGIMRKIPLSKVLLAVIAFALCSTRFSASAELRADEPLPNVVILLSDDQGTLDANCYGSTDLQTPNIDKLAATGVRFTQSYSYAVCCPARAALLTGRHPQRGGVHFWTQGDMNDEDGINMALEEVTLAEVFQAAGYRTALYGKWHLGAHRDFGPKKQGFDEFFGIRGGFIDNYNHYSLHHDGYYDLYEGTEAVVADGEYFPELMVRRARKFIVQNKARPFFLYVPFNIPHYPEQPLKQYAEMYKDMADPARRSYAAVISTTDHYIGQIVDELETQQLRERTIIVFLSDNGHSAETSYRIKGTHHRSGYPEGHFYGASGAGNTGKWIGHKGTFLEGGIRLPAMVSFPPKLPQGEVRDQIVTAMDWYPTLLELCGIESKSDAPRLDGHSLLPVINSPTSESGYQGVLHFQWGQNWAVREGDWKLIGKGKKPNLSLHRLTDDNPEVTDYAAEKPQLVARLQALHDKWLTDVTP